MMLRKRFIVCLAVLLLAAGCARPQPASQGDVQAPAETAAVVIAADTAVPTEAPAAIHAQLFSDTKEFLLYGQDETPSAGRLNWSERFLTQLDMTPVYDAYLAQGGTPDDVAAFAAYLTEHAPIMDDWRAMFEQDLSEAYDSTPVRYEDLGDDVYQVYVEMEGAEVPFVTVNARTGWFHG